MQDDAQITMTSVQGVALVLGVALIYLAIRLLPRLLLGFKAYLPPAEVARLMGSDDQILLLDVRSPAEYSGELGHIAEARNIPLNELQRWSENAAEAEQSKHVVLICRTDTRAAFAGRMLNRAGVARVSVMSGGMSAWVDDHRGVAVRPSSGEVSNMRGSGTASRKQNP